MEVLLLLTFGSYAIMDACPFRFYSGDHNRFFTFVFFLIIKRSVDSLLAFTLGIRILFLRVCWRKSAQNKSIPLRKFVSWNTGDKILPLSVRLAKNAKQPQIRNFSLFFVVLFVNQRNSLHIVMKI